MKRKLAVAMGMALLVGISVAVGQETQPIKKQTMCPVMGGTVNTNLFVEYKGKKVYVCCKGCLPVVKKDPAKYITKLEKEGITLDKAAPKP